MISHFPKLNFPETDLNILKQNHKLLVFDIIRKKNVALTPEEWVRQHLIHYLIIYLNYPASLIQVEYGIQVQNKSYRIDVAAFSQKLAPQLLCECKAPSVKLSTKTITQAALYNLHHQAPNILITNGMTHYCSHFDGQKWHALHKIPNFKQINNMP